VSEISNRRSRLLEELQNDIPLSPRPFAEIGNRCGLSEAESIRATREMLSEGLIREISTLLDGGKLGFKSTLVALSVPKEQIESVAERINRHPGVSHNYLRDHHFNIWFTLGIAKERDFAQTVEEIIDGKAENAMILTALRTFKLRVHLRMQQDRATKLQERGKGGFGAPMAASLSMEHVQPAPLTVFERAVLARLENPLPVEAQPWKAISSDLGVDEQRLFDTVSELKTRRVIRRIAAVLRHRRVGFTANGMAVLRIPDSRIETAGREAASFAEVSHCYQRKSYPQWPYSLYAMVHARTRQECTALVQNICRAVGCRDYQLLYSIREFKKKTHQVFWRGKMNEKSKALYQEARRVIPGGVNSPVRAFGSVDMEPLYISGGKGSKIYDADGKEYIDYVCSWGPLILGHADPRMVAALDAAAARGTSFGANTEIEVRFAELITRLYPSIDMIRMVNSGTEATMSAVRLARGYTGRSKIIKFEGCYHGHGDSFLIKAGSGVLTLGIPGSPGVTDSTARDTLVARFNDLDSVKALFAENRDRIAAVILEPVMGNAGVIPPVEGFLSGLRELTAEEGALLIFDEVITGFRVSLGGAQELYGIRPDLTCLGKIIGGGLPVGAFGGRRAIMEHLAPLGPVYQAGTLSGNPLAMAIGLETVKILQEENIHDRLENLSSMLEQGTIENLEKLGLPYTLNRVGSMMSLFLTDREVMDFTSATSCDLEAFKSYFRSMLEQGIYLAPSAFEASFVSAAHTEQDIERTLEAGYNSLRRSRV
jgi:glutamate-1-semialdehyde 2,1-aminomutase